MSQEASQNKSEKSFSDFVKESPDMADARNNATVTLVGYVFRSSTPERFVLMSAHGQSLELEVDAVRSYTVMQEGGAQRMVQLQVDASRFDAAQNATLNTNPQIDTIKPPSFDPWKVALKETIKDLIKDNIKDLIKDVPKEGIKDIIGDKFPPGDGGTNPFIDPIKSGAFDVPFNFPGGNVQRTAEASQVAAAQNMAPFILATPHHASPAVIAMQQMAAGQLSANQFKSFQDPQTIVKEVATDPLFDPQTFFKEVVTDPQTFKEIITDPLIDQKHPILDPQTVFEGVIPGGPVTLPGGFRF